jgi:hypothetical protein
MVRMWRPVVCLIARFLREAAGPCLYDGRRTSRRTRKGVHAMRRKIETVGLEGDAGGAGARRGTKLPEDSFEVFAHRVVAAA